MNKEEFWDTIEAARQAVPDGSQSMIAEQIVRDLVQKPPEDILDWNLYFYEYRDAACHNDLRAAGTALGVPPNSDDFLDFRAWLIAQGKETYMAAIGNPDTLAERPTIGADMSFEELANCAVDAYAELLSAAPEQEACRLYDKLDHHQLGDQALAELRSELPQRQDMADARLPLDYSTQFPKIWARMTSRSPEICALEEKFDYFIPLRDVVYAAVYRDSSCMEYRFLDTPRNIANFIGSHSAADQIVLTDTLDRLVLDTRGYFIHTCPDQETLAKVMHFLLPIQRAEVPPEPVPCECLTKRQVETHGDMTITPTY